ncbi:MAG: AraC family transcriptional regulator [Clostridiales bacterium]|nr:AraC family transcriptional regulator [Clostridiales bacterium]
MDFLEFDELSINEQHVMPRPHSHDYYELYFLIDGEREFFIENKMFIVPKNTLVVVPPFCIHKTEGGPYRRININVSPNLLSKSQNEFLLNATKNIAVKINDEYRDLIVRLLSEGAKIQSVNIKSKREYLLSLAKTILLFLSVQESVSLSLASSAYSMKAVSPEVLKIIYYINTHYSQPITLKILCDVFFMSKVSLCKKFKEVMNCSIMEYVMRIRLNKAKVLLRDTDKSIEEVAFECGFSSANYFGLTFKKEIGLSPLNYKKTR